MKSTDNMTGTCYWISTFVCPVSCDFRVRSGEELLMLGRGGPDYAKEVEYRNYNYCG